MNNIIDIQDTSNCHKKKIQSQFNKNYSMVDLFVENDGHEASENNQLSRDASFRPHSENYNNSSKDEMDFLLIPVNNSSSEKLHALMKKYGVDSTIVPYEETCIDPNRILEPLEKKFLHAISSSIDHLKDAFRKKDNVESSSDTNIRSLLDVPLILQQFQHFKKIILDSDLISFSRCTQIPSASPNTEKKSNVASLDKIISEMSCLNDKLGDADFSFINDAKLRLEETYIQLEKAKERLIKKRDGLEEELQRRKDTLVLMHNKYLIQQEFINNVKKFPFLDVDFMSQNEFSIDDLEVRDLFIELKEGSRKMDAFISHFKDVGSFSYEERKGSFFNVNKTHDNLDQHEDNSNERIFKLNYCADNILRNKNTKNSSLNSAASHDLSPSQNENMTRHEDAQRRDTSQGTYNKDTCIHNGYDNDSFLGFTSKPNCLKKRKDNETHRKEDYWLKESALRRSSHSSDILEEQISDDEEFLETFI